MREAVEKIDSLTHARYRASLSPHAPYSTLPELLRLTAEIARKRKWRDHARTSPNPNRNLKCSRTRAAKCTTGCKRNERDNSDCGLGSPVATFRRATELLGENVLAVHVNYLARGDATLAWRKTRPASSIARAATIISGMHRFRANAWPTPA